MEIMQLIYERMQERGSNWRICYKSLQLLEYLIKHGSERVIDNAKNHVYDLKALRHFQFTDEKGKDQGLNGKNLHSVCAGVLFLLPICRF